VVEGLSSKCEALSSTLVLQEKKKKEEGEWGRKENNGGDEPIRGIIHVYMKMSQ
jgi:hypothetical protein